MANKWVYLFSEGNANMRELLRHLRTIPTQSWMIYISRRTGSLQSIKIYGTNYLV